MKSIVSFKHINARTIDEAVASLQRYGEKARVISGGTDLIGTLRFDILESYPEAVINLKTIPGLDYIKEEHSVLKIGATARLRDIAVDATVKSKYPALAEAAHKVASPAVREMGTISGNICQIVRCWYFRGEENIFDCLRKGGGLCYAEVGDNRYHSIFGGTRVCSPPCTANCLAGNDIPSYLSSLRDDNLAEAAAILLDSNPLPAITGRVCPHACEKDCNRNELDEALSIRSVERFVGDYILDHTATLFQPPARENKKQVAIIGSGPAGLSAAFFLRKLGYRVTLFEALEEPGGILTYGIPPYRLPKDIVRKQIKAIASTGVQFKTKVNIGKDLSLADLQRDYDAVFCATGAWQQPALRIPDEDLLTSGLDFLTRVNRGLRKLPTQKLLVIGGGSVAIDVALTAKRLGVQHVTLACLESREIMPALPDEIEQAIQEGVVIMPSWGPARVLKSGTRLTGMELVRCTSVFNAEGKFAPTYDNSVKESVTADQVVLAIGQRPDLSYAGSSLQINRGLITVNPETQATSLPKVFAGGDATLSGPLSVVAAIASGRRAAEAIHRSLGGKTVLATHRKIEHLTRGNGDCLEKQPRVKTPQLPLSKLGLENEDILSLDLPAVGTEANRCLNCGCDGVNPSDLAAALVALDARIVTSCRTIPAEQFWAADQGVNSTVLANDEIVTEIQVPRPAAGVKSAFIKFALRKSIDFPIVNCAAAIESRDGVVKSARICLNAVYNTPYRATRAEEAIRGQPINEATAEAAGEAAVSAAVALPYNKYKIQIARTLVKRAILSSK